MPEDVLLKKHAGKSAPDAGLIFRHFPAFASFIKANYLVPYIQEQIRISKEIELPMLKFFAGIPDEELLAMSIESHKEFLTYVEENRLKEQLEKSLALWIADGLGIIKREEVTAEDITLSSFMRKKALIKFLPSYTSDVYEAIEIIKEIDEHNVYSDSAATNVYINLLKERAKEQSTFTEVISNTTPGLNYVFNIAEQRMTYCNKNYLQFSGYTPEQLNEKGNTIIAEMVHPDDLAATTEAIGQCIAAADEAVITWEYRLKNKEGSYLWMRNYASVFKRDEHGAPTEIVGIILDIDQEKTIADRLLISEKQLLEAQEQAQVGSFELDVESGKMSVTPQFKDIYEVSGDIVLSTLIDNVHPADRERINVNRANAKNDGDIYDNEYRYIVNGKEKVLWSRGVISFKNGRKTLTGTAMDVTSRHNMVQQLLRSEALYKQAQELSHIGNWSWDLKTEECMWSEELFRIYEMEAQATPIDTESTKRYRHPDDVALIDETMRQLRNAFVPCDYIFRIRFDDGRIKYLHTLAEVSFDVKGEPEKMFGTVQDVTEKQILIDRLQHSELLYKQAQEISHTGNWSWDLETKKLVWSDELYRIYGLEPQSVDTSDSIALYNHPEDKDAISNAMRHAMATLEPFDFNYRIILKNGKLKTLNAKGSVKPDANKSFRIYGTVQDITEQKNAEKRLKDYQEFIEKITDVTPSIITAYNIHTGKYSFVNDAIEKMLGYPASKILEEGVAFTSAILHPDDVAGLMEKNAKALEEANRLPKGGTEHVTEFKYRMLHKNGTYLWFHTYGTVFERNEKGQVESVLNVSVDITEQEKAEQTLFQKNLQLQQSNTSLEEYAYVASHDLKEPLRKIATFSDRMLMSQSATLNDDGKAYLGKIIDSSKRMQKMIGDLLSVSTIMGNKAFEMCDLNLLLADALQALEHKIEEGNAVIETTTLPAAFVVPSQFRQLFQNLVNNSLKFKREGVPSHIKISGKLLNSKAAESYDLPKAKKYLQIDVEDNGIGFDNQYAGKIFAIFQRLHGKTEYEGTGIGLAVCKKIVENHGGTIFAKGVPRQSAVFTLIIPVRNGQEV